MDLEEERLLPQPDGSVIVDARLPVEEMEEHFGIDVEREMFDTVGGLICHLTGRVPRVGEEIPMGDIRMTILDADERKIRRVRIERLKESGVPPSFDEMKDALDLRSKSGIHRLITALEERGFIRRLAHRARALEIVKLPEAMEKPGFSPKVIQGDRSDPPRGAMEVSGVHALELRMPVGERVTAYAARRMEDVAGMQFTTGGLKKLFARPDTLSQTLRNWGMNLVGDCDPLNQALIRHAIL